MRRKVLGLLLSTAMVASVLSACGSSASSATGTAATAGTSAAAETSLSSPLGVAWFEWNQRSRTDMESIAVDLNDGRVLD